MTDTEQRIKLMQEFSEYKARERRDRIWREVEIAVRQDKNDHSYRLDMLKWGARLELGPAATADQRASQRELIAALTAYKVEW